MAPLRAETVVDFRLQLFLTILSRVSFCLRFKGVFHALGVRNCSLLPVVF